VGAGAEALLLHGGLQQAFGVGESSQKVRICWVFICELEKMGLAADFAGLWPRSGWPFSGRRSGRAGRSRAAGRRRSSGKRAGCEIISKQTKLGNSSQGG